MLRAKCWWNYEVRMVPRQRTRDAYLVFLFLASRLLGSDASLLAQSKLEMCERSGGGSSSSGEAGKPELDCAEKVTLLLSIEQAQLSDAEAIEVSVENEEKKLAEPLKITWSKTRSRWKYPLRYMEQIPAKMQEHFGTSASCTDDVGGAGATCGICRDAMGNYMKYSEGFCCMCSPGALIEGTRNRGSIDCGDIIETLSRSYHCIKPDRLWYAAFEVETPIMLYEIQVQVKHENRFHNLTISHTAPVASNSYVMAELTGDLAQATPPNSFQQQYLVVPDRYYDANGKLVVHDRILRYPHHLKYAMLLDKSFFDLSGDTCDKIGVGWTAFKYQPHGCERTVGDCVRNQIENFHQEDTLREGNPLYFVSRFCDGLLEGTQIVDLNGYITDEFFVCPMDETRQTTMVRLELKADDLRFVSNIGKAVIVTVEVEDFEAFSGAGVLKAVLKSESDFAAQFSLGIQCSQGVTPAPVPSLFLQPLEAAREVEIQVMANSKDQLEGECTLNLLDKKARLLDTKVASFTVLRTIEKSSLGQRRGDVNAEYMDAKTYADASCSDVCGFFEFGCHLTYFGTCWWNFLLALLVCLLFAVIGYGLVTGRWSGVLGRLFGAGRRGNEKTKESGSSGFAPSASGGGDVSSFFLKMQEMQQQNALLQMQLAQQAATITTTTQGQVQNLEKRNSISGGGADGGTTVGPGGAAGENSGLQLGGGPFAVTRISSHVKQLPTSVGIDSRRTTATSELPQHHPSPSILATIQEVGAPPPQLANIARPPISWSSEQQDQQQQIIEVPLPQDYDERQHDQQHNYTEAGDYQQQITTANSTSYQLQSSYAFSSPGGGVGGGVYGGSAPSSIPPPGHRFPKMPMKGKHAKTSHFGGTSSKKKGAVGKHGYNYNNLHLMLTKGMKSTSPQEKGGPGPGSPSQQGGPGPGSPSQSQVYQRGPPKGRAQFGKSPGRPPPFLGGGLVQKGGHGRLVGKGDPNPMFQPEPDANPVPDQ
ncbi:unnamed protein product [Amoebophrya sp. A25]|nr:unnamed protein product [Amoebophrya sp. A25]|eukprot:GSA25T00003272001.1